MTPPRRNLHPHSDCTTTNTVRISNLPNYVNRREVIGLFDTLIGEIRNTTDFRDAIGTHIEITFASHDAAKKAMCMSGYTLGGCSLNVTAVPEVEQSSTKRLDTRRNLYVLGIPFDLTKSEFCAIFSRYGPVAHCVVLATVDNASRRRGFVVMASHEDARRAMTALTRTQIKGHTIDVSWSIVQRSEGFLDGGDRSMLFDSGFSDGVPSTYGQDDNQTCYPAQGHQPPAPSHPSNHAFTLTFTPSTTILVTNLPFILFSSTSDLEPLLCPFGKITKLEMIALPSPQETTSALVEYTTLEDAKDAKESLQGQCYANYRVNAEYVCPTASSIISHVSTPEIPNFDPKMFGSERSSSRSSCSTVSGQQCFHRPKSSNAIPPRNKRPLQDISNGSHYFDSKPHHPFQYAQPSVPSKMGIMTRSSSAAPRWTNDTPHCPEHSMQFSYPSNLDPNAFQMQNHLAFP
ncbi:hypothetical protein D9758_003533 [Tetrapyrgos nigripes]|uniref:RRM domain-containing protein n=1 Tax=Tetrapyrgos nigripes TaxID=182062 RepID=A0A8H5GV81_9AGAR|nr:hypothetical protein D9758_003533 [Tetrapyrgos nigripes]